jgi:hypothetical protein
LINPKAIPTTMSTMTRFTKGTILFLFSIPPTVDRANINDFVAGGMSDSIRESKIRKGSESQTDKDYREQLS